MTVSLIDADTKDKNQSQAELSVQNRTDSSALDNHQWVFSELQTQRKQLAYSMLLKQKKILHMMDNARKIQSLSTFNFTDT